MNAKEILSGKRERELFDPDEARRQAAAKRAAAAAERERAEEEMIARWKEEDRAKAEAARQKAAAVAGTAAAEEGEGAAGGPSQEGPEEAAEGADTAVSTSTLAGRSKKNPGEGSSIDRPAGPAKRDEIPLPPPPPEPTQPYAPPVTHLGDGTSSSAKTWPVFGCDDCDYNRHGCYQCLMGPPVRSAFKPESAHHYDVPSVPVYHPTEEEWAGDPLAYINKIRPEAEKFGVCNIVCPPSWRPEFRLPNKDELRFRTRIQAVNELQDRPAGPSKRARENAAKARAALEAAGIDPATFPPGFLLSGGGMGGGGGRMGGGGQKPTPPAPDTPPGSTGLNDDGGGDGDDDERGKRSESPSKGDATEGARTEKESDPNSNAAASHKPGPGRPCKQHPKPPPTEAETKKADAILAQYGFTSGERHTVKTLERYSDYFKRKYFSGAGGVPIETSIRDLEGEFWRLVESPAGRSVEVIYGADIATMEVGSGLTNKVSLFLTFRVGNWTDGANLCLQDDPCLDAPDQKRYATSPWNVCNMPYNPSSCLKHVEATTGITVPWLYFGMTLSTFCWHVEDHHFYSVNYHHFGTFLFLFIFTWVGD